LDKLAALYGDYPEQDSYADAVALAQESLAIKEHLINPYHLEIAKTLNFLAYLYAYLGQQE